MTVDTRSTTARLGAFVFSAAPPAAARARAAAALLDTIGVTLAGASEPAARIVQRVVAAEGGDACRVLGTGARASATGAALALQRLVLPAVHWMDDTRPFGILRPRTPGNASVP